jgi:hypothetical protein
VNKNLALFCANATKLHLEVVYGKINGMLEKRGAIFVLPSCRRRAGTLDSLSIPPMVSATPPPS